MSTAPLKLRPGLNQELKDVLMQIHAVDLQIDGLTMGLVFQRSEFINKLRLKAEALLLPFIGSNPITNYVWDVKNGWGCEKSPLGVCVYDDAEDPCHDQCIFCYEPYERK